MALIVDTILGMAFLSLFSVGFLFSWFIKRPSTSNNNEFKVERRFEVVSDEHRHHPKYPIVLPRRADVGSAGYDIYSPCSGVVEPGETWFAWMDVKVKLPQDEYLAVYVRSSMGKKGITLTNSTGIIDSSYYNNKDNDGNFGMGLHNRSDVPFIIQPGDRIGQAIFTKYSITDDDSPVSEIRNGGYGSTGR